MGELYKLEFASGKSYIGITTKTARERFHGHRCRAAKGDRTALYNAWRAHGEPKLTVLAVLENSELASTEQRAILAYNTFVPGGYNSTPGGDVSPMLNAETRMKASKTRKGVPLSDAHRAALSAAQRGKPRPGLAAALRGKKMSPETRAKISAAGRTRKMSEDHIAKSRISAAKARAVAKAKRQAVFDKMLKEATR